MCYANVATEVIRRTPIGKGLGLFQDEKSRHPRRTFATAEGQTTTRIGNKRFEGILASPSAVQSLLSTGKAPRGKSLLGQ